jgi:nucleoside-diphosphate-sugar epimerase
MKILISGATGFLGRALSQFWQNDGHEVGALLRAESEAKRAQLESSGIRVISFGDICDVPFLAKDFEPDAVVHTACSYGRAGESVSAVFHANVALGVALLDAASQLKNHCHFINTGTVLDQYTNYYALTKWQFTRWGEHVVTGLAAPVKFTNVALQHMYGPHDDPSKFTTFVLRSCLKNVPKLELTKGEQLRDFIYIDDVVTAYDTLLKSVEKLAPFENVEVGLGTALTIRDFVKLVHDATSSSSELVFGAVPYRDNEAMVCRADITKMLSHGWAPVYDVKSGMLKTIELESF